jgi:hemerythrin-like domain-containing protein
MSTRSHSTEQSAKRPGGAPQDAISLLTEDHEKVKKLFEQYDQLGERAHAAKKKLALQICTELTKHATVEEDIFYPAVRDADPDNEDIVNEAYIEHASAKDLIAQLLRMDADEEFFDATVKVLSEQIAHHIEEEESEMFPKARKSTLDLDDLAQQMAARKKEVALPPH